MGWVICIFFFFFELCKARKYDIDQILTTDWDQRRLLLIVFLSSG